jgi:hypothetical protein
VIPQAVPPPVPLEAADRAAVGPAPWQIPPEDLQTQRLYRVRLESRQVDPASGEDTREGRGRFKLTLRLATPSLFQLTAVDPLGRALWTLHVEGDEGLLVDYRERRACRYGGEVDLADLRLGPFPIRRLPVAILGRLPAEPPPGLEWREGETAMALVDRAARRWTATFQGAALVRWRMERPGSRPGEGSAGSPGVLFTADGEGHRRLVDGDEGLILEWRETLREPLAGPPGSPEIPRGFSQGGCEAADPEPQNAGRSSDRQSGFDSRSHSP